MPVIRFLGLNAFQWIALLVALLTLLVLADAWGGHYRRGFIHRAQYAPFLSGGILVVVAIVAAIAPHINSVEIVFRAAGWLAIVVGLIGFGLHHYYGILSKPGGYGRILNSLLYGAPPLAPLALTAMGVLALIAARGLLGLSDVAGVPLRTALLTTIFVCLLGAVLQTGLLHFRGAFNNPLMYAPLTIPVFAAIAEGWMLAKPGPVAIAAFVCLLWLTMLTGFVGLGMHLRGFDRQMGGLYVPLFNWLQGPPAFAPALFAGFAAIGLVTTSLL